MPITAADKLSIYNGALRRLGSRKLASVTENREPRRVLDDIWGASSEVVKWALERGDWNNSVKMVEGVYSASVEPEFGFARAYDKPDDFCRLTSICADPYFRTPLIDDEYTDEAGYWFTDYEVIYVRYVSNDDDYGFNSAGWSESFKEYLECKMAWEACERITNSRAKKADQKTDMMEALAGAKSVDSMNEGVKFPPTGSWVRARGSNQSRRGER